MFSWLIRDAPQQRLSQLIQRITKISRKSKSDAEIEALAELLFKYRINVKTFEWKAVREVLIDRLEGSRRSIKRHEKEAIVRTAVLVSIQTLFSLPLHLPMDYFFNAEYPAKIKVNAMDSPPNASRMMRPSIVCHHSVCCVVVCPRPWPCPCPCPSP